MARHARTAPHGRHRAGSPGRIPAAAYLTVRFTGHAPLSFSRSILRRWITRPVARHSFQSLARAGARPRPVLAIIASL